MHWKYQIFVDTCLPFGLRSAPKLFNILADLLSWILEQQGVTPLLHYLDDFLLMGPPQSPTCQDNLSTVRHVCSLLGIPLALETIRLLDFLRDHTRHSTYGSTPPRRQDPAHLFHHGSERKRPPSKKYYLLSGCSSMLQK